MFTGKRTAQQTAVQQNIFVATNTPFIKIMRIFARNKVTIAF